MVILPGRLYPHPVWPLAAPSLARRTQWRPRALLCICPSRCGGRTSSAPTLSSSGRTSWTISIHQHIYNSHPLLNHTPSAPAPISAPAAALLQPYQFSTSARLLYDSHTLVNHTSSAPASSSPPVTSTLFNYSVTPTRLQQPGPSSVHGSWPSPTSIPTFHHQLLNIARTTTSLPLFPTAFTSSAPPLINTAILPISAPLP